MAESPSPDAMKKLATFLIGLAVFGLIIALVIYFVAVLPGQTAAGLDAPTNGMYCQINIWGQEACWDVPGR
jgi:hypothetical protein